MTRAIALYATRPLLQVNPLRSLVVCGCAAALILAKAPLPF